MDTFNLLSKILNKNDYFKYFFIVIFLLIFINNSDKLLSYRFIVSLLISSFILFLLLNQKISIHKKLSLAKNNKYKLLEKYKLHFLYNDEKIIDIFVNLIDMEKYNPGAFKLAIDNMELFMKKVNTMEETSVKNKSIEEAALHYRKESLNQLMSIILTLPSTNTTVLLNKKREVYSEPNENRLKIYVEKLRELTKKHIIHMINQIDNSWNNDETYNSSSPVYFDTVEPNIFSDYLFSNKFNIY